MPHLPTDRSLRRKVFWLCLLTGALGVVSGYALFVLWWQEGLEGARVSWVVAAIVVAALLPIALEFLHAMIEREPHALSVPHMLSTATLCVVAEVFATAAHTVAHSKLEEVVGVASFIFGPSLPERFSEKASVAMMIGWWMVAGMLVAWGIGRYIPSHAELADLGEAPDVRDAAEDARAFRRLVRWSTGRGAVIGALCGVAAVLIYVLATRALLGLAFANQDFDGWKLAVSHLPDRASNVLWHAILSVLIAPVALALNYAWGPVAFVIALVIVASYIGNATKRPGWVAVFVTVSGLFVVAAPYSLSSEAWNSFWALLFTAAVVWGAVGLVLGVLLPILSRFSDDPTTWGIICFTAAVMVMIAASLQLLTWPEKPTTETKVLYIVAITACLVCGALFLWGRLTPRLYVPLAALCVGSGLAGVRSALEHMPVPTAAGRMDFHRIQEKAYSLIALPMIVTVPERSLPPAWFGAGTDWMKTLDFNLGCAVAMPLATIFDTSAVARRAQRGRQVQRLVSKVRTGTAYAELLQRDLPPLERELDTREAELREVSGREADEERLSLTARRNVVVEWKKAENGYAAALDMARAFTDSLRKNEGQVLECVGAVGGWATLDSIASVREQFETNQRGRATADSLVARSRGLLEASRGHIVAVMPAIQARLAMGIELAVVGSLGFWVTWGWLAGWAAAAMSRDAGRHAAHE